MDDPDGGTVTAVARLRAHLDSAQPPLAWTLRGYRRTWLRGDLLAGVTVAALILPLGVGYAQVAGLPPEAGLYASLVPLIAYAVFGSARLLIVGPDAGTAALVAAAIVPLAAAPTSGCGWRPPSRCSSRSCSSACDWRPWVSWPTSCRGRSWSAT